MAAVLSPVLSGPTGDVAAAVMSAAYSVGDLLLVAMIAGVSAVRGSRRGSMWKWLAVGLATFCAADVAYALQVAANNYAVGTAWSSLWLVGLTIVALGIWRPQRPVPLQDGRRTAILAVPTVATITAVGVLVVPSFGQATVIVDALAIVTLVLAAVRIFIGFRQVQRLSDAHRQAVTDDLTGVGNRRALFEHGAQRLGDAAAGERVALMLIDLDDFKEVNDALGHHAGDELLREMARRLSARADAADLLVRLGGDEFALVITLAPGEDGAAERRADPRAPRPAARHRGDSRARRRERRHRRERCVSGTIAELLRRADVAMYAAKKSVAARVQLFDPQLDEANLAPDRDAPRPRRCDREPRVRAALPAQDRGRERRDGRRRSPRALAAPDARSAPPRRVPAARRAERRRWAPCTMVLEAAVGQLAAWRASDLQISVAVNLSASDLLDEQLAERIVTLLAVHDVPISALRGRDHRERAR